MCKKRVDVLNQAFKRLDFNKDGVIDVNDLIYWYKFNNVFYQHGEKKVNEVSKLFVLNYSLKKILFTIINLDDIKLDVEL